MNEHLLHFSAKGADFGHFYAVGVGPGASDMLTIRAAILIQTADVIIAPRSKITNVSLSLQTVQPFLQNQEIIEKIYPMERNSKKTQEYWRETGEDIAKLCAKGKSVVQITIGDPLFYSTSGYLVPELLKLLDIEKIHIIPGISAMQAVGAVFKKPLALQEDRLTLMSGSDINEVEKALGNSETLVLYKVGRSLPKLFSLAQKYGIEKNIKIAFYVEQSGATIFHNIEDVMTKKIPGYMATAIIYRANRSWEEIGT